VAFTVAPIGLSSKVAVTPLANADGDLEACIVRNVTAWRFQAVSEPVEINKTYRFGPGW